MSSHLDEQTVGMILGILAGNTIVLFLSIVALKIRIKELEKKD
jgi:hypothetical protein